MKHLYLWTVLLILCACNSPQGKTNDQSVGQDQTVPRFFNDSSFWNQPIPENAETDDRSDYWISLLERDPSGENIGINVKRYTIPIFEVQSKELEFVKVIPLRDRENNGDLDKISGHEPEFDSLGVPIPPSVTPSPGRDMHLAIVDWEAKTVWDMFYVKKDEAGNWSSATGMVYPTDGPGVFDPADFDVQPDESIHLYGPGVAAGMPIVGGVVRYDEVMSGEIRHKLCIALRFVAYKEYVYPAIWTDGNFEGGIPEGAVLQLDPDLDLSQFDLTREEMVVAKALQEYGCVVNDFAAGSCLRAEYLGPERDKSWKGKIRAWDEPGGIKTIPVKHYRVLKVENVQTGGDRKKEFFLKQLYFEGEEPPEQ